MLNFSPEKLFLVGLIALIVLGPNRLPQAARTLGRFMAELRRMSAGFHDEVRDALGEPTEVFQSALSDLRAPANMGRSVRDAITSTLTPPPANHNGQAAAGGLNGASTPAPPTANGGNGSAPAASPGLSSWAPAALPPVNGAAVSPAPSAAPPEATGGLTAPDDPALN